MSPCVFTKKSGRILEVLTNDSIGILITVQVSSKYNYRKLSKTIWLNK